MPSDAFSSPPHAVIDGELSPFVISIPEPEIRRLKELIKLSTIVRPNWENSEKQVEDFGVTHDWLVDAAGQWSGERFDWRQEESMINALPQFRIEISDDFEPAGDGKKYRIHFAALFSKQKDAVPILFLHGWPGSFLEFLPIMHNLQREYGDRPEDLGYHIIAPSLTGFGFSDPPPMDQDFRTADQARLLMKMMSALGFGKDRGGGFIVQGGDIGSFVAMEMAERYSDVNAVHTNLLFLETAPEKLDTNSVTYSTRESRANKRYETFSTSGADYARLHGHRPSTIGLAIGSSPLALLCWIGEKMVAWSDPATVPDLTVILRNVSLYWFTRTFPTSIWYYRDFVKPGVLAQGPALERLGNKPFGFSSFPMEVTLPPKSWLDATGRVTWYREKLRGGHFAALEQPYELWGDVVDFIEETRAYTQL